MKTKKNASLFTLFLIISLLSINNSCSERNETVSCFPNSPINAQLDLNLPLYYNLQNPGNWAYVNKIGAGTRGLIVYRKGIKDFLIYDRNAPHLCPDNETTLEVKNGTAIHCPKDGAEWILSTGEPIKVAKINPKFYPYTFDPNTNILSIYN